MKSCNVLQVEECSKGAEGSTMRCKAHGGGRRCRIIGCVKSARGGTLYCTIHGREQQENALTAIQLSSAGENSEFIEANLNVEKDAEEADGIIVYPSAVDMLAPVYPSAVDMLAPATKRIKTSQAGVLHASNLDHKLEATHSVVVLTAEIQAALGSAIALDKLQATGGLMSRGHIAQDENLPSEPDQQRLAVGLDSAVQMLIGAAGS